MELQEFITQTLLQITGAVTEANKAADIVRGKEVTPKLFLLKPGEDRDEGTGVHFDVAVTVRVDSDVGAGAKARLAVVQIEIGGKQATTSEQVSRVSFSVSIGHFHA